MTHYYSEVRKKNMADLEKQIKNIENGEHEKELEKIILNFSINRGLTEKTVWKYYRQLRKAGRVK